MKLTSTLAAAALAATVSLTAPAGDWYVDSTRGDDGAAGTQAAPFATIKHALESAGEGDTICLADGTYSEYGLAVGNGITITSVSQDATAVTVDGQKKGKVFTLSGGATLSRITIQNGNATDSTRDDGANITVGGGSRVLACRVLNGVSGRNWDQAGGIFLASGLVENCLIKGNQAAYGGGLYVHATGACRVINCTLVENIGTNDGGQPSAAIFIERNNGGSINLWNTVCFNSKSSSDYAYGSRKDIFMRTGTFHNCAAVSIATQEGASTAGCTTIGQDAAHFDANYVPLASSVLFDGGDEPEISGYTWPVTDLAGMTRVQGEKVDIGCYETNADALVAANPRYAAEGWTNNTPCTLSVDVLGGKAPYSFAWDFKDGTTEQTSEPTVPHVFPAGAYSPKVTVTDANGTTAVCEEWPVLRFCAAAPMYVDASCASPLAPYTNRLHAATTLDEALLMTCAPETGFNPIHDNVTIYVAEGTYDAANVQSPSKSRIHLNKAIRIVGTADDPSKVVIRNKDKKQGWRVFWLEHPDAVLANVTVSGGSFKGNSGTANAGGGVRLVDGTITNCLLTGSFNAHSSGGGPAYGGNLYQCGGLVVDSTITAGGSTREGYSDLCGGNVCLNGGRMTRCRITDGIGCPWDGSDNYGNNVFAMAGRMDSCLVSGGQNGEYSVYVQGTAELVNCTIANNKSAYTTVANHSGVFVSGDTAKLVNCLFYQNGNSSSAVNNWGSANGMAFSNCAAQTEITDGTNCQLVTAEQLADTATCVPKTRREAKAVGIVSTLVDKGALVPKINGSYGLDLIGNPRRVGNNLDIGCYEVDGVGGLLICIGSCRMISTH